MTERALLERILQELRDGTNGGAGAHPSFERANFQRDLGMSFGDVLALSARIEEELGLDLDYDELIEVLTVGDLAWLLARKCWLRDRAQPRPRH